MLDNPVVDKFVVRTVTVVCAGFMILTIASSQSDARSMLTPAQARNDALLTEFRRMPKERVEAFTVVAATCVDPTDNANFLDCTKALRIARMKSAGYALSYQRLKELNSVAGSLHTHSKYGSDPITDTSRADAMIGFLNGTNELAATLEAYYATSPTPVIQVPR